MGRTFTDSLGKEWSVALTLSAAKRIDASDLTLVYPKPISFLNEARADSDFFENVWNDNGLAMALVWVLVKPQADLEQIDEDAFCERLDGRSLNAAKDALWEEIMDFFPHKRTVLSRLKSLYQKAHQLASDKLDGREDQILSQLDKQMENEFDKRLQTVGATSS